MNEVINTVREELKTLNSDLLVVIWGGVNDIRKNNTKEALNSVSKFVNENKELNVVLINSPHGFDILPESCVNQGVIKFNRQIRKIMEHQSKVKILEVNLDRNCFTTHGLHLNNKGKKLVSQDLARLAQHIFNGKQILSTIFTPKKDPPVTSSDSES
jgi:hypothetical protein